MHKNLWIHPLFHWKRPPPSTGKDPPPTLKTTGKDPPPKTCSIPIKNL